MFVLKPASPFERPKHPEKLSFSIRYFMFWLCMYGFVVTYYFSFCSHIQCFRSNQRNSNPWGYRKHFNLKSSQYKSCHFVFYVPFMKKKKTKNWKSNQLPSSFAVLLIFKTGPAWLLMILVLFSIWFSWSEKWAWGWGISPQSSQFNSLLFFYSSFFWDFPPPPPNT